MGKQALSPVAIYCGAARTVKAILHVWTRKPGPGFAEAERGTRRTPGKDSRRTMASVHLCFCSGLTALSRVGLCCKPITSFLEKREKGQLSCLSRLGFLEHPVASGTWRSPARTWSAACSPVQRPFITVHASIPSGPAPCGRSLDEMQDLGWGGTPGRPVPSQASPQDSVLCTVPLDRLQK